MDKISIRIQSVLYKNDKDAIVRTLDCLANSLQVGRKELPEIGNVSMVYGDASDQPVFSHEEVAALAKQYNDIFTFDIEVFGENTGTAKGHNRLAKNASSDYIMIMNPDILLSAHLFPRMLAPFHNTAARVGVTEARQTPIEHGKYYDKKTGETSWISTACVIIPLSVFNEVGGFDEECFFMYCDDVDFSWMLRLAGYKAIYVPSAPVYHAKRLDGGNWVPTDSEVYYSAEAGLMMAYKWSHMHQHKKILKDFLSCSEDTPFYKAAQAFLKRKKDGRLPNQLDAEHKVANVHKMGYGRYRFHLD